MNEYLFLLWFMAESASGQGEANPVFWLVTVYLSGQDKLYEQRRFWATHVNRKWTFFHSWVVFLPKFVDKSAL